MTAVDLNSRSRIVGRLSAALEEGPVPQAEIGRRLNKARSTISDWKKGRTEPDLVTFAKLCRELGVSADEILGLRPEPPISRSRLLSSVRLLRVGLRRLEGEEADQEDLAELEAIAHDLRTQATGREESSKKESRSETLEE